MTTMNSNEREERLKDTREYLDMWNDTKEFVRPTPQEFIQLLDRSTFLLSLLDSQAVDFNSHYEGLMRAALLREQNAATRMRDKCVAKLDSLAKHGTNELVCAALGMAARSLESLTLDQVEQKQ